MTGYTNVIERVPAGISGDVAIIHDTPDQFTRLRAAIHGMPLDREKYVRLIVDGDVMMTDAEFERRTNRTILREARGHCLVAGLGIGLILDPLISACESVTVVEINADVIALVAPYFPTVTVHHTSIFDWKPTTDSKYDAIYFDIWPHFNSDTNAEAASLHRKFRRYLAPGGFMESWTRIACKSVGRR